MEDQLQNIIGLLQDKAVLKQHIYRATQGVFQHLKTVTEAITKALSEYFEKVDKSVIISYHDIGEFEFHVKFSGDLLMFQMQTNIHTFGEEHLINKSPYVREDFHRGYFGTIVVYNFMADSLKYNRLNDPGYLLARMLLNCEGHYYIEGVRQLNFLHPDIAENLVNEEILRSFILSTIQLAVETDLVAPPYQEIQIVALGEKLQDQMAGAAKVGFQMKAARSSE
jgi:hypothetical protein